MHSATKPRAQIKIDNNSFENSKTSCKSAKIRGVFRRSDSQQSPPLILPAFQHNIFILLFPDNKEKLIDNIPLVKSVVLPKGRQLPRRHESSIPEEVVGLDLPFSQGLPGNPNFSGQFLLGEIVPAAKLNQIFTKHGLPPFGCLEHTSAAPGRRKSAH